MTNISYHINTLEKRREAKRRKEVRFSRKENTGHVY
jgi:hypothetical protein